MPSTHPRAVPVAATYRHGSDRGFCQVCGTVWPCSRADRDQPSSDPTGPPPSGDPQRPTPPVPAPRSS